MSTNPAEPSLQALIDADKAEAAKATETPTEVVATPVVEDAASEIVAETKEVETTEATPVEEVAEEKVEAKEDSWLRSFLAKAGYQTDGVPEEELESFAAEKIKSKPTAGAKEESATRLPQQEVVESKEKQTPPADKTEQAEEKPVSKVEKLQYDASLAAYVTFDDKDNAVPNPDFGAKGVEAAEKLNAYTAARRKRAQEFIDDPVSYVEEDLLRKFESRLEAKLAERDNRTKTEREQEAQRYAQEIAAQQEQSRVQQLLSEHRAKLYVVGEDGEPRRLLKDSTPVMTPYGRDVDAEFRELRAINPMAPHSVLIEKAMKIADRYHATTAKPDAEAVKEKKQAFLEQGKKHSPTVSADKPATSLEDRVANKGAMTLLEMIKADAENEGNPALSKL